MKSLSLILRIVAIVAALAAAGIFFVSQGKLAEKQTALEAAESATKAVQGELDTSKGEVSTLTASLKRETESLRVSKTRIESLESEMHTAKGEVTRTQTQLIEKKSEIEKLNDTVEDLRSDLLVSEKNLAAASKEGELAQLNERIKELEAANQDLTSDLEAKKQVLAARNSVKNAPDENSPDPQTGLIYKVNNNPAVEPATIGAATTIATVSTEDGILVLNSTPELGLTAGTEVTIIQDLVAIAKVQIVSNENNLALANILPGANTSELIGGITVNLLH